MKIWVNRHNDLCEVCNKGGNVMCCSFCNLVYHPHCLLPKLDKVPEQEWACPACAKVFRKKKKRYHNLNAVKDENEKLKKKLEALNEDKRKREEKKREEDEKMRRKHEIEKAKRDEEERKRREAIEKERERTRVWTQDEAQEWYDRKCGSH